MRFSLDSRRCHLLLDSGFLRRHWPLMTIIVSRCEPGCQPDGIQMPMMPLDRKLTVTVLKVWLESAFLGEI
jgi:hypothetical protein